MATKNETPPPAPAEAPAPAPKRKFGKVLLIGGLLLILLIGGGTAAFLMLTKAPPDDPEAAAGEEKPAKKKKKDEKEERKPAYTPLEPFTVNLSSESGDQFLQIAMTLDMQDASAVEKSKIYMAKIRNDVMLHLSGKKPAELATKEGKQILAVELRNQINAILDPESQGRKGDKAAQGPVREVLFTSFIIQ